ncbi:MAG: fumarate hydratase [Clostridiaceae bacterium]|nr:fumarate hydratase [Clostridiaceae bacterium]
MREISVDLIRDSVARLCQDANILLPPDIQAALREAVKQETSPAGLAVLEDLLENAALAGKMHLPICQDTGMAVVFADIGQEVHITGGWFEDAVRLGVADGYTSGYLRPSVVSDPLLRQNTGDNTPPVIHTRIVPGDQLHLTVAPKGFGSENMSATRLLSPSEGRDGIRRFVLETVEKAGPNPCPPVVIGIGLGGTLEKAALLAKQALLLPAQSVNEQAHLADLERDLLQAVNRLGIGPGGLGGRVTALALHILAWPTHIAGLPVVLNMSCHATRHAEATL